MDPTTPPPLLATLRRQYPLAFPDDPDAVLPLAIGIRETLVAQGHDLEAVRAALAHYTASAAYQRALADGTQPRIGLDGQPVGPVSPAERHKAAHHLEHPGKPYRRRRQRHGKKAHARILETLRMKAVQTQLAITLQNDSFRQCLDHATEGAATVPIAVDINGREFTAHLNPTSFRKAVAAFREAGQPVVVVEGVIKLDAQEPRIDSAHIRVKDKKPPNRPKPQATPAPAPDQKPAPATSGKPVPVVTVAKSRAPAQPQPPAQPPQPTPSPLGKPKLSLKPKPKP
ncbi:ProQ/FINO family protein [Methylomagnum ishizawai]|uniref:ProQ/FINO family protein n=1 Tax=Methylomagnum ishizawai TaxID=1760988 RepID=A0A1Y6CW78_9GAMM|nr:ProQ/FinO family protein [Methylomagnum ishizawai]SMF94621.1 ProQ/FINO family protein [Methylomagnum ishizawai]